MVVEDDVRRVALSLPGAHERQSYGGNPSWRTKPRMFTWIEKGPLVVWAGSVEEKEELLRAEPAKLPAVTGLRRGRVLGAHASRRERRP